MELIIKPTEKCNFSCTFCSSPTLSEQNKAVLNLDSIEQFLDRFPETNTIIINGGDPLMMPPDYYWSIIKMVEARGMNTTLAFTSNLWAFYKNPKLWAPLFRHPLVGVATSFNYGETRRITKDQVYTEDIFWKVSDLFLQEIGYRPSFISVINEDNASTAIENVKLAQRMNVECKLNYAMASGRQSKPFVKGKIYRIYMDILEMGLGPWEYNCKQILNKGKSLATTCPLNRECDLNIRCLQPDGDYYSCGSFGDDKEFPIDFAEEMKSPTVMRPLLNQLDLNALKEDCYACPLFSTCNGCKKTIRDLKNHNLVEEHCSEMQQILPQMEKYLNGISHALN